MLISTRGRYAIRVLIDIAEQASNDFIRLKDITGRQEISQKYVENIMTLLSKNGLVEGVHGKGGGYRLTRDPAEYKIADILKVTEESLSPVACLECNAQPCKRMAECRTLPMWRELNDMVNNFFNRITLADLVRKDDNVSYLNSML